MINAKFFHVSIVAFVAIFFTSVQSEAKPLYRGTNVGSNVTLADIQELCDWGSNVVRYQLLSTDLDGASVEAFNAFLQERLDNLDTKLDAFANCGIKVYLDLHTPPGGIAVSTTGRPHNLFLSADYQTAFISAWQTIATRYNGDTRIHGYIPASEPRISASKIAGVKTWAVLAQDVTTAIRAIDAKHVIQIMAPYGDAAKFSKVKKIRKAKFVVYGFDFYYPSDYTKQGLEGKPTPVALPSNLAKKLKSNLSRALKFKSKNKVKLEVSEYSVVRYAPGALTYLSVLQNLFEKNNISSFYHAHREAEQFDVELGSDPSNQTRLELSEGEQLLRKYFAKN